MSCSALLRFLRSTVTLMEPSAFGMSTRLDSHVTGPWCASMTSSDSIFRIASSNGMGWVLGVVLLVMH